MNILQTITEFIGQYIPDFPDHVIEYLLIGVILIGIVGVIKR